MSGQESAAPFVTMLIALVVTTCALMLSIPPLFQPHEPWLEWMAGVLGLLAAAFALGLLKLGPAGRYVDPTRYGPSGRYADE